MKWAIVGLTALGVIAAGCAALLVSALRANSIQRAAGHADGEVQVLTTAGPIREMTVVEPASVVSKSIPRSMAPPGYISDPVQVVDRILLIPMTDGQIFTTNCFAKDEKSVNRHLASLLPKGKRAVGITVSDYAGLEGVLYPGCAVDIMVSGKTDADGRMRPTSKLLLENIPVWAIEKETIVSAADNVGADADTPKSSNHRRITLLVDSRQAKQLERGMEEGTLSLALRNPLDTTEIGTDGDEPLVASSGGLMGGIFDMIRQRISTPPPALFAALQTPTPAAQPTTRPSAPQWKTLVIRGDQHQIQSFPITEGLKLSAAEITKEGSAEAQPPGVQQEQ